MEFPVTTIILIHTRDDVHWMRTGVLKRGGPPYLNCTLIIILIFAAAIVIPGSAADPGNVTCQGVDRFGNQLCGQIPAHAENYVPEDLVIYGPSSQPRTGTPFIGNQLAVIKKYVVNLSEIALRSPKESLNQTRHPGTYYFNIPVNSSNTSEESTSKNFSAQIGDTVKNIKDLQEISSRAVMHSLATSFSGRRILWNTAPVENRTALLDPGVIPDENYLALAELKASAQTPQAVVPVAIPVRPVQPVPTINITPPVSRSPPVPVFNLSVDSYPSGALIVLNGNRTGTTPYTMNSLPTSIYTMNLTRSGYMPYGMVINLDKDMNVSVPLTSEMDRLFPKPGTAIGPNPYGGLYVTSFPNRLALTIDGVSIKGGTPFLYYGLPEGYHTIQIAKPDVNTGTEIFTRMIWIYHDALVRTDIDTEEVHTTKQVSITSTPYSGAEFTVNGEYPPGRLPATLTLEMPRSFVSVHSGDAYISMLVPSLNTDTVPVDIKKPDQPHGLLKIESNPDGADIFIDGFPTGTTTPHTFKEVSAGLHRVSLSKLGYYPSDDIITVPITDDNTSVQRLFYPLENYGEGTIVVDSIPPGAGIYLNGWATGEVTPHTFDHLKIGFYEVVVSQGGRPWIDEIELTPDKVYKSVADFNIMF